MTKLNSFCVNKGKLNFAYQRYIFSKAMGCEISGTCIANGGHQAVWAIII